MLRYNECLIISVICYALYLWSYIPGKTLNFLSISGGIAPLILVAWVVYITNCINKVDNDRQKMIDYWGKIQKNEFVFTPQNPSD